MIREYIPYIEAGEIGVAPSLALGICQGANDIIGSFIGAHVAIPRLKTIDLGRPGNTLSPDDVRMTEAHTILLTLRAI